MNENEPYSEGFAENSGVKIFYRDYGPIDGDPILMVHGLGAQLVHWPPHLIQFLQAHNFAQLHTIIEMLVYPQDFLEPHLLY